MDRNGLAIVQPRTKIFALQPASKAVVRTQTQDVFGGHFAQRFTVVAVLRFFKVKDFENLLQVGLGIGVDLLARQRWAGFGYAGGVANHRGKIADEENRSMAEILK